MHSFASWYSQRCCIELSTGACTQSVSIDLEQQITVLADAIRSKKAAGEPWKPMVDRLNSLKDQLPEGHPMSRQAFDQSKKKADQSKKEEGLARQRQAAAAVAEQAARMVFPTTQRKLPHLLRTIGAGDEFKYASPNILSDSLRSGEPVWLTEKWDGTTVQATCDGVFKRLDKFVRGSKQKRGAPVADRYALRLVAWKEAPGDWRGLDSDQWIAECVSRYLHIFEQIPAGLCIYFEAVHHKINATFKQNPDLADIRVFDVAKCSVDSATIAAGGQWPSESSFDDFQSTIELCSLLGLPIVHHKQAVLSVEAAQEWLSELPSMQYTGIDAPLEGFVVRAVGCGERVTKLRGEYITSRREKNH